MKMSLRTSLAGILLASGVTGVALAEGAAAHPGVERAKGGAVDAITSPVKVVDGVQEDTAAHGAVGVVTGTVKGGARAAVQLVTGAMNVGVGVVEAIAAPLTRKE